MVFIVSVCETKKNSVRVRVRSVVEHIFSLKQIALKALQEKYIFLASIDIKKAFQQSTEWKIMEDPKRRKR